MTKNQIIALLQDGAYLDVKESKFVHSSFRKGFRKMLSSDISFRAAEKTLSEKMQFVDGKFSISSAKLA